MKIQVLLNLGTNEYGANSLQEGVHEVTDEFGALLVRRKLAVRLEVEATAKMVEPLQDIIEETQPVDVKPADTNKPSKAKTTNKKE